MAPQTPTPVDVERTVDRLAFVVDHRTRRLELPDGPAGARAIVALLTATLDDHVWWAGIAAEAAALKTTGVPDAVPHGIRWAVIARYALEASDELRIDADADVLYAGPVL